MYVPTVCPEIWLPDFGIMDTFLNVGMVYVIKNQSLRVLIVQAFISVSSCHHTSDFLSIFVGEKWFFCAIHLASCYYK